MRQQPSRCKHRRIRVATRLVGDKNLIPEVRVPTREPHNPVLRKHLSTSRTDSTSNRSSVAPRRNASSKIARTGRALFPSEANDGPRASRHTAMPERPQNTDAVANRKLIMNVAARESSG